MSQLEKLKIMLGIKKDDESQDDDLTLLLEDVATDLLTWTNRTKLPSDLESVQRQIAVIRYNMQGVEGQTAHSEGGVSRSFDDLPQSIRDVINQRRLLKVVCYASPRA
ncbi:phage head-tail connector protein [Paenibacillus apiarius]|uniref:Phage head-tail connector protein n=1 Tax=Paenibacillus apiarius TaxID=46240 RepID=A0ABT4DQS6_9BACL|nr:phage head-tail connector protein [Paenibacillus apiarius]MCY9513311.1 phage head-tail connector protein [Paenibacillus apiarius]MCY9519717.1 phage head-tail connector protein [Paenibacillus apiarius]MCY9553227.1 phage head-tail connector protein [Paenibacillus apiarius]MCY9557077.1 phage head-tail connector protein [Paenibacillus apiarius]MCY9682182.1 phage head-tail connector protein [Paenibacillus apiarius]